MIPLPARMRLLLSLLVFPLAALILGFGWQKWHPEGLWRGESAGVESPAEQP